MYLLKYIHLACWCVSVKLGPERKSSDLQPSGWPGHWTGAPRGCQSWRSFARPKKSRKRTKERERKTVIMTHKNFISSQVTAILATAASRLPRQVPSQTSLSFLHPHHLVAAVAGVALMAVVGGMIMVRGVRWVVHVVHVCWERGVGRWGEERVWREALVSITQESRSCY